jgi:hypothetical protein
MSDIFVSYDDLDRARVRELVEALEARGWSVWWDHRISAGDSFSLVIERELDAAQCVIVVWTRTSVDSDWVRAEADEAWKRGKLVPVLLDRVTPPMPFGQIHAADLVDWSQHGHSGFAKLISDLHERIGRAPARLAKTTPAVWSRRQRMAVGGGAALLLAIASALYVVASARPDPDAAVPESAMGDAGMPTSMAGEPLATASDATAGDGAEAAAVAGHWQAAVTYPDGARFEERFTFDVAGGHLSGTASMRGYGNRRGILDGSVDGNRLSFRTTGQIQLDLFTVRNVAYRYQGLLDGDTLRFSVVEEGTGDPAFAFISRRISAEQANRIATGGRRPRLSGMSTNGLYRPDHVRDVMESARNATTACYEAAEYDEVSHEFVSYHLTLGADGSLAEFEMRPRVPSLELCMREALAATKWGRTDTGEPGVLQLSIEARLPWNP